MIEYAGLPKEIRSCTQDYQMQILEVRKMEDVSMFYTDVRQVLNFIRYSDDKEALKKLVTEDPYYQNMEGDAWDVIVQYAKVGNVIDIKDYYREDGKIDMCQGLIDWMEDERREGERIGEIRGERIGEIRGEKIGEIRGEKRGKKSGEMIAERKHIHNLMKNLNLTEEQAAAALEIKRKRRLSFFKKKGSVSKRKRI